MLRGAEYFTEEEWIKLDRLIHKGRYVFTSGPQTNVLDEELITFDDTTPNENQDLSVQIPTTTQFETIKEETIMVSELEMSSPAESERAHSTGFPMETPLTTSAEVSSDDDSVPLSAESKSTNDFAQSADPTEIPKREPMQIPTKGGLAFYTQAQLDEVKAFNSGLTKAGQKQSRSKHNKHAEESYSSPAWSQNEASEPTSYPSSTPTEHETRTQIQTWASDVHAQDTSLSTPAPEIASPAPTKGWTSMVPPEAKPLLEIFKKTHGRNPKSINDLVQPNTPEFRPLTARPFSRLSHKSTKSTGKSTASVPVPAQIFGPGNPKLKVSPGTVLIAQRSSPKLSKIQIEVKSGDQIKVLKHVSGITHTGENLRTGEKGQFNEVIFKKNPETADPLIQQQRAAAARAANTTSTPNVGVIGDGRLGRGISITGSTASNGLERIEGFNAAEWDDVGSTSNVKAMTMVMRSKTSAPPAKPVGGLGASRFAALAVDEEESVNSGSEAQEFQGMSKEEVGQLFDEKVRVPPHRLLQHSKEY